MKSMIRTVSVGLALTAFALAGADVTVPKGQKVSLVFSQAVSSKTVKAGDKVQLKVKDDVFVDSTTVLRRGTSVTGIVGNVEKRKRYGVNAQLRIALNPVRSVYGTMIPLEPRQRGNVVGSKTGQAAAITTGGAILLGPIGLIGGYFVAGKEVNIKAGAALETQVTRDVLIHTRGRSRG